MQETDSEGAGRVVADYYESLKPHNIEVLELKKEAQRQKIEHYKQKTRLINLQISELVNKNVTNNNSP